MHKRLADLRLKSFNRLDIFFGQVRPTPFTTIGQASERSSVEVLDILGFVVNCGIVSVSATEPMLLTHIPLNHFNTRQMDAEISNDAPQLPCKL